MDDTSVNARLDEERQADCRPHAREHKAEEMISPTMPRRMANLTKVASIIEVTANMVDPGNVHKDEPVDGQVH